MDKALESILEWWDAVGVDVPEIKVAPPRKRPAPKPQNQLSQAESPLQTSQALQASDSPPPSTNLATSAKTLDDLKKVMSGFHAGEISDHARQMVFARGNPNADIMVIGEAPGYDEDVQGKPFVGKSGQLLDKVFASIGHNEETLYITNVVNWRPPGNRNPKPAEIELCKPFLLRHIELINPKIIVLVGGISMTAMTGLTGIMKNRGQWTTLNVGGKNIPALPIYHPAFLLRQPITKKDCWRDMLSLQERLATLSDSSLT